MPHGHGIVSQQLSVDSIALGVLTSRNAIILNSAFNTPTATFLMKRVRFFLQLVGRTAGDDGPIVVGCCRGDATVAEIAAAMNERNVNGPDDITNMLDQDKAWVVYQNTVVPLEVLAALTEGKTRSEWISFGGKRGIPAVEGAGMSLFAFNCGSGALTTGSSINGLAHLQGVWLGD